MKLLLTLFASASSQFSSMLAPDQSDFCNSYRNYTSALTADRQGAYVVIDDQQFIRNLTAAELADLARLKKNISDGRVACN
jgi:hypothetical protein